MFRSLVNSFFFLIYKRTFIGSCILYFEVYVTRLIDTWKSCCQETFIDRDIIYFRVNIRRNVTRSRQPYTMSSRIKRIIRELIKSVAWYTTYYQRWGMWEMRLRLFFTCMYTLHLPFFLLQLFMREIPVARSEQIHIKS